MRWPPSIRTSLFAWFVSLAVLLLAAVSFTLALGLRAKSLAALDARLLARAESLQVLTEWEASERRFDVELDEDLAEQFARGDRGQSLGVWSQPANTRLLRAGADFDGADEFAARAPEGARCADARDGAGHTWRACSLSANRTAGGPGARVVVVVAAPPVPLVEQLGGARWFLLPLMAATLASVIAFGLLVSTRFARPLARLTSAAESASGGGRVPMPRRGTGDELDRLADVLDSSFGELASALERQARFTADAAHELRNPIAILQSAAEAALRRERDVDGYKRCLRDVHAASQRMGKMVASLLELARLDASTPLPRAPHDLCGLVAEIADVDPRVSLIRSAAPIVGAIEPDLVRLAVRNLVDNALRHTAGPIEVSVAREREASGDTVVVRVRDHGDTATAAELRRAFARFVTLARQPGGGQGAGLGLSIVESVARRHGGSLDVEAAAPGLVMTLRLPAA